MGEAGLLGLVMMLAKISRGVKELLGDDRRLDVNFVALVKHRLAVHTNSGFCISTYSSAARAASRLAIAAFEERAHIAGRLRPVSIAFARVQTVSRI